MRQMPVGPVKMIGQIRTALATLVPVRAKHEMVDDELVTVLEKISQRFFPGRPVEHIFLVDLDPWKFAACRAQSIPLAGGLPFTGEEIPSPRQPPTFRDNLRLV